MARLRITFLARANGIRPPQPDLSPFPCAKCGKLLHRRGGPGHDTVYQIETLNGIEDAAYCSEACAKTVRIERGKPVKYCLVCAKPIPVRVRQDYPNSCYCSHDCTDQAREDELMGFGP